MAVPALETAAFRKAVAVSAACEAYRRAGCDPREIRRSAEATVAADEALLLSEAAATRWLRKHGCVEYLGGGSFGHVYKVRPPVGRGLPSEIAVKLIASFPSSSKISGNVVHEYEHQRLFAEAGLAWEPHGLVNAEEAGGRRLSCVPAKALKTNVAGILMPLLDTTLDKLVKQRGPSVLSAELGERLVNLLRGALERGMAHNDAKPNNVGVRGHDVRFIDFGRALSVKPLQHLDVKERWETLQDATLADALRLALGLQALAHERDLPALRPLRDFVRALASPSDELRQLVEDDEKQALVVLGKRLRARLKCSAS